MNKMTFTNSMDTIVHTFPQEILEIVFLYLDPKTFITCRRVCKTWREILDYLSEKIYWKLVCEKNPDIYRPIHEKGLLNWKNVYKNSCLWKKINKAVITVREVITNDTRIEHIFVNNDEELCITLSDKILIKDASTFEDIKCIEGSYSMFIKNRYMAATLTNYKCLHLQPVVSKHHTVKTLDNVQLFRIINNKCIFLTSDKKIWECILKRDQFSEPTTLTRWYNSDNIISIHCYENEIYFLSESGKYLTYRNNRLMHIDTFTWDECEYINYQRFHLCREFCLIYSNDSILYVQLQNGHKRNYSDIRQITAILLHGNILCLGTHWGKVFIYAINKLEDLLYLQLDKPLMTHSLEMQPIFGFDVFEEFCGQTLFVRTRNKLTSIHFDHKQIKNCE